MLNVGFYVKPGDGFMFRVRADVPSALRLVCPASSAVLKRATTIKRRGMDAVHRGQPGEESYGDISSVGEYQSGQAHKYRHRKPNIFPGRAHTG